MVSKGCFCMQRMKAKDSWMLWQGLTADTSSAERPGSLSTAKEEMADPLMANTPLIQPGADREKEKFRNVLGKVLSTTNLELSELQIVMAELSDFCSTQEHLRFTKYVGFHE